MDRFEVVVMTRRYGRSARAVVIGPAGRTCDRLRAVHHPRAGRLKYSCRCSRLASARPMTGRDCRPSVLSMSSLGLRSWNVALAAAAAIALVLEGLVRAKGGLSPAAYVLAIAASAPLVWAKRAPLAALLGVEFGGILCDAAFDAGWAASGMVIVALYTVALLGDRQRS